VKTLLRRQAFDVVHRVTPSGWKDSLLPIPSIPLVLGPVLGTEPISESFLPFFRPSLKGGYSPLAIATRFRNGIARRIFQRDSTLEQLIDHATLILIGTRVTQRTLPAHVHYRTRWLPYAGVEHELFLPPRTRRANRVPQLLFVGRLVPYKGLELLLYAAAQAKRRSRFRLTIVGGGSDVYRGYCQELAGRLGLTSLLTFIPEQPRSELVRFYQAADVFCLPSIETYGIAILEAMSSGCAVLVSDCNGPAEIVCDGTGLKVPLENPDQFINAYAERIIQLVEDASLRDDLGQTARERVRRIHDWPTIQSRLLQIYDETVAAGQRPAAELPQSTILVQK
jgi:glycosyltransferase involved in cell wall biosynthesis